MSGSRPEERTCDGQRCNLAAVAAGTLDRAAISIYAPGGPSVPIEMRPFRRLQAELCLPCLLDLAGIVPVVYDEA